MSIKGNKHLGVSWVAIKINGEDSKDTNIAFTAGKDSSGCPQLGMLTLSFGPNLWELSSMVISYFIDAMKKAREQFNTEILVEDQDCANKVTVKIIPGSEPGATIEDEVLEITISTLKGAQSRMFSATHFLYTLDTVASLAISTKSPAKKDTLN